VEGSLLTLVKEAGVNQGTKKFSWGMVLGMVVGMILYRILFG
jgi:hypothetical protein